MKCPDCGKQLVDGAKICPYCRCKIVAPAQPAPQPTSVASESPPLFQVEETQNNKKEVRQKNGVLAVIIIVAGIIIIGALIVYQTFMSKKDSLAHSETTTTSVPSTTTRNSDVESKNQGIIAEFYNPTKIGNKVIATFYDSERNTYTDVDVVGLMFMSQGDVEKYGLVPKDQTLNDGFAWRGIKYRITLNDLYYLDGQGVNPLDLETTVLDENGLPMVEVKNHYYGLTYTKIDPNGSGTTRLVKNGDSVDLYLVYQKPISSNNKLKVCFGNSARTMSCFSDY